MDKKYQDAKTEDKLAPNTLLEMQEIPNAPWDVEGSGDKGGMTRDDYIAFVKDQERMEEQAQIEPTMPHAPNVAEIGI